MKILIIDDEPGLRKGIGKVLTVHGYQVFEADSKDTALEVLKHQDISIALLDLRLAEEDGTKVLLELKEAEPLLSVIIITGYGNIKSAVTCMNSGAINYLTKPIDHDLLLSILRREREHLQLKREHLAFSETMKAKQPVPASYSQHQEMHEIDRIIEKVKDSPATVLISGETGTGKEVTAKKIHYSGVYHDRPLVGINCSALNDNLLESELFGHEKGAFTGAVERKIGRFELAGTGTLFLDEIGDMSPPMQAKLLRVLQEQTFERVGGTKSIQSFCRIIAATNKLIEQLTAEGFFRSDLYYRLSLIRIHLPPLRCRPGDIPGLIKHFIHEANIAYNRNITGVSPRMMKQLCSYHWPGNIRELKNTVSKLVILSDDSVLENTDIVPSLVPEAAASGAEDGSLVRAVKSRTAEVEKQLIREALTCHGENITQCAQKLGVSRKTLYDKMRKYGL